MDERILRQIGDVSSKAFFAYQIQSNHFDTLTRAAEQIWETDLQTLSQNPNLFIQSLHPDDLQPAAAFYKELQQGTAGKFECRISARLNKNKILCVDAYPIKEADGSVTVIAGFIEDITIKEEYKAYLLEFARRKNTALEIVAHDLRGPLAIVQSVSDAIEKDRQGMSHEEISTFTRFINKACETCINLISDLLLDEHLKSPTVTVKKERVDIIHKLREAVESYSFSENIQNVFKIETEKNKLFIEIDIVKFDQIVNNLISNSIKFTAPSGTVTIAVKQEQNYVMLTFSDTGIGIPEDLQPYVFDRYTRASRPGLQGEQSKGIGLSIVRNLVEIQGGHIYFESAVNKGTSFYITFPMK